MTDLLVRPEASRTDDAPAPADPHRPRLPLVRGTLAAVAAAGAGLLLVEVVVAVLGLTDGRSHATVADVLRVGAVVWLLAHGAVLSLADGSVSLLPLGITALSAEFLRRAGATVARRTPGTGRRAIPGVALAVAVPYAALVVAVALIVRSADVRPSAWGGALGALLVASVAAGFGAAGVFVPDRLAFLRRGARVLRFSGPSPSPARVVLRAALVACGVLLAGAALVAAASIALHIGDAAELARDTEGGALGHTGVLVVQFALVPNVVVWFLAYLTGPGFSVGGETSVALWDGHLGEVPALPMFAGLPGDLALPLLLAMALVPLLAAVFAGRVVATRLGEARLRDAVLAALAAGPVTGVFVLALVAAASGRVLGGGLAEVGASAWRTGLAVTFEVSLLASATVLGSRAWQRRRAARAARRTALDLDLESGGTGAHRRKGGTGRGRTAGWLRRPAWLHRPSWLRLPTSLHRPGWLRRRRSRRVIQLPD